jgi:CheY-like chemotaxis protein
MSWLRKLFGGGDDVVRHPAAPLAPPRAAVSLAGQTILVADPSLTTQQVARLVLEPAGGTVACVTDASEISAAVRRLRPSSVLLAGSLAAAGGAELFRSLREIAPGVRLVLMAGTFEPQDRAAAAACDATIAKPFEPAALLEAIAPGRGPAEDVHP